MKRIIWIVMSVAVILGTFQSVDYIHARKNATVYISIINTDSAVYPAVKERIEAIVSPETKSLLFDSGKFIDSKKAPIPYGINAVHGRIKGFRDYTFEVSWTIQNETPAQITSAMTSSYLLWFFIFALIEGATGLKIFLPRISL